MWTVINNNKKQLIEVATYSGCFGDEFESRAESLKSEFFDFEVSADADSYYNAAYKKVQLGKTMRVTVTVHTNLVGLVSPYALVWNDDYYYVLGYCEQHDRISKFRVDRIDNISITSSFAKSKPKNFEPVTYLKSLFSMYDGELQKVRLKCDADMMKVVVDRFGKNVKTKNAGWGKFYADVEISVSRTFFGWLFGFGGSYDTIKYANKKQKKLSTYLASPIFPSNRQNI